MVVVGVSAGCLLDGFGGTPAKARGRQTLEARGDKI